MSSTNHPALQGLRNLNRTSPGFHDQVCNALYEEGYQKSMPGLQGDDLAWLVEYLNEVCRYVPLSHSAQTIAGSRWPRSLRSHFPKVFA